MKKQLLLSFCIILFSTVCLAGGVDTKDVKNKENENSKIIIGKVLDSDSKEEIAGAEIIIAGKKVYTDLLGNFSVIIPAQPTEATVKFISYQNSTIKVDPFSYAILVIEIVSQ